MKKMKKRIESKKSKKEMMKTKKRGFTLAEIIISMTIIGVIAAITIPALLVSTNDKTMNAQKKALEARMSQAISQIEDLRVYGAGGGSDTSKLNSSSSLNFITKALSKVYRITKTCDKTSLTTTCGFPTDISTQDTDEPLFDITKDTNSTLQGYLGLTSSTSVTNTDVAGFKTANGESIALFYNPSCYGSKTDGFFTGSATVAMCINMIYDLNGKDGAPNEVGKDIGFVTVFFPKDADVVVPVTYSADLDNTYSNYSTAVSACKSERNDLILPTWEEGMAMALNKKLTGVKESEYLVSGSGSTGKVYTVETSTPSAKATGDDDGTTSVTAKVRCVYSK